MAPKKMTMDEIATLIRAHLKRIEDDPKHNKRIGAASGMRLARYWHSGAGASGRFIYVCYVSYRGSTHLTRDEALIYLAWLDKGHVGRHWQAIEQAEKASKEPK